VSTRTGSTFPFPFPFFFFFPEGKPHASDFLEPAFLLFQVYGPSPTSSRVSAFRFSERDSARTVTAANSCRPPLFQGNALCINELPGHPFFYLSRLNCPSADPSPSALFIFFLSSLTRAEPYVPFFLLFIDFGFGRGFVSGSSGLLAVLGTKTSCRKPPFFVLIRTTKSPLGKSFLCSKPAVMNWAYSNVCVPVR